MRGTIKKLRNLILEKANLVSGDEVTEQEFAKHPGIGDRADDPKKDMKTWETYLWKNNNVFIILSFNEGRHNAKASPAIILHGKRFLSVSLFIYDNNQIDIGCSSQHACDVLNKEISKKKNDIYEIKNITERRIDLSKRQSKTKAVGHVLNLKIRNTGTSWNIGANLNSDQLKEASAELVNKVVATLNDLLPVARYYAENRENLLSGKI